MTLIATKRSKPLKNENKIRYLFGHLPIPGILDEELGVSASPWYKKKSSNYANRVIVVSQHVIVFFVG